MNYLTRDIENTIRQMFEWFPIISVTGPRQSGKSTLIRHMFKEYDYLNLEDNLLRRQALRDPVSFIESRPNRLIIDEAQLVPDLFSQIQVKSDEADVPGQYVISGSQNFLLLNNIKQSLAGRVGILRLLPLSYAEIYKNNPSLTVDEVVFKGGYPRLYRSKVTESAFFESYIDTYLLRDITGQINASNSSTFKNFAKICAQYAGNLVNLSNISRQAGISRPTTVGWLNLLNTSYITFELRPYFNNNLKSLTKTPKIYFYDTGLLVYMLGIRSVEQLLLSPHLGKVFENFIISETIKNYRNNNVAPELYYYRDNSKLEVDLVDMTDIQNIIITEIKSGKTYRNDFVKSVNKLSNMTSFQNARKQVVMRTDCSFNDSNVRILSVKDYLLGS